jgi:hypothetical protein
MVETVVTTSAPIAVPASTDVTQPTAVVNVAENGWFSKINWAQAIQVLAAVTVMATGGKINISPEQQLALVTGILVVGNIVTVIIKTYFTPTVTKQSVGK